MQPSEIETTIRHGIRAEEDDDTRFSEMPAFGDDYLEDEEITQVVHYVMSLSPVTKPDADPALAKEGAVIFADNCSSCHGENAQGDRDQGAPNLADAIWLYGDTPEAIEHTVRFGPFGVMPAWALNPNFDEADIKAVATYVHQLGGGE